MHACRGGARHLVGPARVHCEADVHVVVKHTVADAVPAVVPRLGRIVPHPFAQLASVARARLEVDGRLA
jgi:hypothetical protein